MKIKKSQMWFTDFAIGIFIFSLVLISYYSYSKNILSNDQARVDDLYLDSQSISSSVLQGGYPDGWNNETVERIGITNNDYSISNSKIVNFKKLNYNMTKKIFGTVYDYVIFFQNGSNTTLNIEGICTIGYPDINSTYEIKAAYYFKDNDDAFLKDFMSNDLQADIYSSQSGYEDFDDLANKIDTYDLVVIEHPLFPTSDFNQYEDDIEDFVSDGKILILSGEIVSAQGREMANVKFYKKSGQSISDRNSTVVYEDPYLAIGQNQNIVFAQAYYVEKQSQANSFTVIAEFNSDGKDAIARWNYGSGKVFYFSDFDVSFFNGDFTEEVTRAMISLGNFKCMPITMGNVEYDNFLRLERYLSYNGKLIKMVLYLWE